MRTSALKGFKQAATSKAADRPRGEGEWSANQVKRALDRL
jgi:hypothetical protein